MTPSHRAWAERFIGHLQTRIADYGRRAASGEREAVILSCLQDAIDRHRAALAADLSNAPAAHRTTSARTYSSVADLDVLIPLYRRLGFSSATIATLEAERASIIPSPATAVSAGSTATSANAREQLDLFA